MNTTSKPPEWAMLEAGQIDLPYTLDAPIPCNMPVARALAAAYARGREDAAGKCKEVWIEVLAEAEGGTPTAVGVANVLAEGARRCLAAIRAGS